MLTGTHGPCKAGKGKAQPAGALSLGHKIAFSTHSSYVSSKNPTMSSCMMKIGRKIILPTPDVRPLKIID